MRTKNSIFLTILILIICNISICQSPSENLGKYWFYRSNFFDKFILDINPNSLPSGAPINGINLAAGT
jgi:hypothetical protein